jgi:hypothetical protein
VLGGVTPPGTIAIHSSSDEASTRPSGEVDRRAEKKSSFAVGRGRGLEPDGSSDHFVAENALTDIYVQS